MQSRSEKAGFTLLEMIVTLSLIAILSSIVYVSSNHGFEDRALARASSDVGLMVKAARAEAIMAGRDARLIVNLDDADADRFLRYVGVVTRDADESTKWVASHPGIALPEGIYVVPESSAGVIFGNWDESISTRKSRYNCSNGGVAAVVDLEYPVLQAVSEGGGVNWMVYQFSPDGRLDTVDGCAGSLPSQNNQIVLAPAELNGSSKLEFNDSSDIGGLVIRQNGTAIGIENPADFYKPSEEDEGEEG